MLFFFHHNVFCIMYFVMNFQKSFTVKFPTESNGRIQQSVRIVNVRLCDVGVYTGSRADRGTGAIRTY